jgi:hypothetical protein
MVELDPWGEEEKEATDLCPKCLLSIKTEALKKRLEAQSCIK